MTWQEILFISNSRGKPLWLLFFFGKGSRTLKPSNHLNSKNGVLIRKNGMTYHVRMEEQVLPCSLSSKLRNTRPGKAVSGKGHAVRSQPALDPVAVGDRVCVEMEREAVGMIVEILPRSNQLARPTAVPMPGAHAFEQVFAANVDQVVPIFAAANPAPKWNMLDRYLVCAEAAGAAAVICITKCDLLEGGQPAAGELMDEVQEYRRIGYPVLFTSTVTGEGLDSLKEALQGRVSVLVGKSGVGKTTLVNALQPGLGLRTHEVSGYNGKGRHTTAHVEMFALAFGGDIIDTPGVREFGLWDVSGDELPALFPEMRPFLGRCKFGLGCRHDEEPGCALRRGVMEGSISPRRYQNYLKLLEEIQ
jgi:ribosome biogenesis GTPase / thiamine phosphate phosphatase